MPSNESPATVWRRLASEKFTIYENIVIAPPGSTELSGELGAVDGDDEHCRSVCLVVASCSAITRADRNSSCLLHASCMQRTRTTLREATPGSSLPAMAIPALIRSGGSTSFILKCSETRQWTRLSYRLPVEGAQLGVIAASNTRECRAVCDMMPGCNSFARVHSRGGKLLCHLKGQASSPASCSRNLTQSPI